MRSKSANTLLSRQRAANRSSLLLLVVLSLALGAAIVSQAALLTEVVARVLMQEAAFGSLAGLLAALLAVMGGRVLLVHGNGRIGLYMAAKAKSALRGAVLQRLLGGTLLAGLSGQAGGKVSVALDAVDEADSYFSSYLPRMLEAAFIPLLLLVVVFSQHTASGWILLVSAPFIPLFMALIGIQTKQKAEEKVAQLAAFSGTFLDALQGLVTLKLYGRLKRQQQEIERSSLGFRDATMGILRLAFTNTFMLELIVMLGIGLVALELALQLFLFKTMGFETAFFILLLVPEFYSLLKNMGTAFHSGRASMGAVRKVEELLAEAAEEGAAEAGGAEAAGVAAVGAEKSRAAADAGAVEAGEAEAAGKAGGAEAGEARAVSGAEEDAAGKGAYSGAHATAALANAGGPPCLELRQLRFSYAPAGFELVADQVTIAPGDQVAIVGKSGSGKTTLLHLIAGLLKPLAGEALVRGIPLEQYGEAQWFSHVSYITQHPYIFAGTVAENIAIGSTGEASRAEIEQAAEAAGLAGLIGELPQGFDTPVGEGGRGLSGGEKQRLALARAFLKRPSIILFDEPTVGLDLATERILQRSIAELAREATMITVAHRLHTIRHADRILFMENGKLLASGNHAELLQRLPHYAEMVKLGAKGGERDA